MDLTNEINQLFRKYGIRPKKSLSQNFVADSTLLDRMIDYAEINSRDVVLEIGPGLGFLTERISEKAGKVIAVEKDHDLIKLLRDRLGDRKNIVLIESDILRLNDLIFDKIISNPPYQLSSPLIFNLLRHSFKVSTLTLQKEFAERLTASKGTKEYGRLTVMANIALLSEIMEYVRPNVFYPQPDVESAVLRITFRPSPIKIQNKLFFSDLVRELFTQRNKISKKVVRRFIETQFNLNEGCSDALTANLPYMDKRVFQISPEEFVELSNLIWAAKDTVEKICN